MFIAQRLKKENIVEYLIYMWQVEDIIRACSLDIDILTQNIIVPQKLSVENQKVLCDWYESLIEMMTREGIRQSDHLQINKNVLNELIELHDKKLAGNDASYSAKFYHVLPYISQLRLHQPDKKISDIEICFNFLYGILLLRVQKKEISSETAKAQVELTKFMRLLSNAYKAYKSGELEE